MSSKIKDALVAASKLTPKRGESDDEFMTRVHYVVAGEINDAEWAAIPRDAQNWNNDFAATIDAKQPMPAFPDWVDDAAVTAQPTATTGRRRGAAATGATGMELFVPKLGAPVVVTTKRGKVSTGIIVELTADEVVINAKGEDGEKEADEDFVLANVTIVAAPPVLNEASARAQQQDEPTGPMEPQVGDTVQVVTARDKTIMGNVDELDADKDLIVIKDPAGNDHELSISRLKSAVVKHRPGAGAVKDTGQPENKLGVAAPAPAPAGRGRRAAAAPAAAAAGDDEGSKPTVGTVIRDTLVDNPDATIDDCEKALTKAGIPFSPVTVKVAYKTTQSTVKATMAKHGIK